MNMEWAMTILALMAVAATFCGVLVFCYLLVGAGSDRRKEEVAIKATTEVSVPPRMPADLQVKVDEFLAQMDANMEAMERKWKQ